MKAGMICIGVARKLSAAELETSLEGANNCDDSARRAWVFDALLKEGDTIGVAFGQTDLPNLAFTKNGKPVPSFDVKKIGGMVYPVVSVANGGAVKVVFDRDGFLNPPPARFSPLMVAHSVL